MRWLAAMLGLLCAVPLARSAADLGALCREGRWFEARALGNAAGADPILRGAVAVASGDAARARRELAAAVAVTGNRTPSRVAESWLYMLELRLGRMADAAGHMARSLGPEATQEDAATLAALRLCPNQRVLRRRPFRVSGTWTGDGRLLVPVALNGQPSDYLFDTGSNISLVRRSEAERAGLRILDAAFPLGDLSGGGRHPQLAVADSLGIGGVELRDVTFGVVEDEELAVAPGQLALSTLLAVGTWRWHANGDVEGAFETPAGGAPNLAFDATAPVVRVMAGERVLTMPLDTGSTRTYLFPAFARRFPRAVGDPGAAEPLALESYGDAHRWTLAGTAKLALRLGSFTAGALPLPVLANDPPLWRSTYDGAMGMDLLHTADAVTLDFVQMRLRLDGHLNPLEP